MYRRLIKRLHQTSSLVRAPQVTGGLSLAPRSVTTLRRKHFPANVKGFTGITTPISLAKASLAMAAPAEVTGESQQVINDNGVLNEAVTVIRYQPGNERFEMQLILKTGKTFNFNRKCADTLSNVLARIGTNVEKKYKAFKGTVKFLPTEFDLTSIDAETTEIDELLKNCYDSASSLKLQIDDDVYEVVFNPPEVYSVKFLGSGMPTLPFFPYRLETSDNFCKEKSLFKWEFSREKPSPPVPPKLQKKSENVLKKEAKEWVECGTNFVFTPEKNMEGGYLRFSCTPSNGITFGKHFSVVLSNPIEGLPAPVERFLYEERLSRMSPKPESGDSLRVLTYNALADTYATPEWFISSPKESLEPGYRLPILNKEIKSYQADLICLQEVDEKYFEGSFLPYLSLQGYKGFHTSKTGNTKEGIATFHNPAKLTEIEHHVCVILDHMKTLPMWERLKQVGDFTQRLEERNTVFQLSVFQINNCPRKTILLVGNVHLYFHPDADHIRLLQTITCLNFLESKFQLLKEAHPDQRVAVIFCGDFNCTPPFSSYRLLTTGQVDEDDFDWTSHSEEKISPGIAFKHSLNLTNSHPGQELTNITTCFEGCLDYILFQSEHFEVLNTYPPPNKEELAVLTKEDEVRKVSLPNFYTPSDHLPLITDLKFKN